MGPKKEKIAKEPLEAVALIDERLPFQDKIVAGLAENFQQSGKVKCVVQKQEVPSSIQWMSVLPDSTGKEFCLEDVIFVYFDAGDLSDLIKTSPSLDAETFLQKVLLGNPTDFKDQRIKIFLVKTKQRSTSNRDKAIEAELKRLLEDQAFSLSTECLTLFNIDLNLKLLDEESIVDSVIKGTKSILDVMQNRSSWTDENPDWYPRKSGPPVSVNKNKVGLVNLYQRYLMQVSKGVNIEQAKVISSDPGFASIDRCLESYDCCQGDDKRAVNLLSGKSLRPAGATKASLSLGSSRPCVGPETSKKVHKVMTSLDGNDKI